MNFAKKNTVRFSVFLAAMLVSEAAFAADGHFEIPNWVTPEASLAPAAFDRSSLPRGGCANKPELLASLKAWRQQARQGYAEWVAKHIPSLNGRAQCIKKEEALDARYEKSGDYWVVSCLAQSRGELTHLFKLELVVEPAQCLSDAALSNFVNSPACQRPGEVDRFVNLALRPCPIGPVPPKLRAGSASLPIGAAFFASLLNNRPSIGNIMVNPNDHEDRRVKTGGGRRDGGASGGDCNAISCFPGAKDAR